MHTGGVVGREAELESLHSFLSANAPGVLLLRGEPGIGKTTLWEEGVARALAAGRTVLSCRPTAAEAELPFGALADLLEGVLDTVLPALPGPQRRALEVALLLEEPGEARPEARAIAVAFTGCVRELAAAGSPLLAIDDVQWLDRASADVLAFAARRLRDEPVAFLLAERVAGPTAPPLGLDRAPPEQLHVLPLAPLRLGALHELLRTRIGAPFPRPVLRRIETLSAGNPFFALQLARAVQDGRDIETVLPDDLALLIRRRLDSLPEQTKGALLAVALLAEPTISLVAQAVPLAELEPALAAGVVAVAGRSLRFTHPLLAVAAREASGPIAERDLRRRLGELAPTLEERAWHLAASAETPDESVASVLHEAARSARQRGAPAAAAELAEAALQLSPVEGDPELRARRTLDAAVAHVESGDAARAQALLEPLIDGLPASGVRAEALWRLGAILRERNQPEARPRLEQGLEEAVDATLRARLHGELAWVSITDGTVDDGAAHAAAARELATELGDDALLAEVLGAVLYAEYAAGRAVEQELVERALALEQSSEDAYLGHALSTTAIVAYRLFLDLELDKARELWTSLRERAAARGDETAEFRPVYFLAFVELFAGSWALADELATEAIALSEQAGAFEREALYVRSAVDAHLGRLEEAVEGARRGLTLLHTDAPGAFQTRFQLVLGFVELSRGAFAEAATHLRAAGRVAEASGVREPAIARFRPDESEALVAVGELDAAEAVLDWFETRAVDVARHWALAVAARPRGLVAAARGDLEGAIAHLERSRAGLAALPVPFEQARTLLALGGVLRRARRRRDAREALEQALALFEALPAPLWSAQARAELERIGGRRPGSSELTPSERRVAELVAAGRSNKEVAAILSVSTRTVENHLARIYAKLDVRTRTALAARLAGAAAQS